MIPGLDVQHELARAALTMARAIQQECDEILRKPLTWMDIERIVAACGYNCRIKEVVSQKSNGLQFDYVYAFTRGAKNQRNRSLGRLEDVQALSQDELVELIASKFEKKGGKGSD